jgi:hypothetical protein
MGIHIESIIVEIRSELSKLADAGLIDDNSLYRDAVKGLKALGTDVMTLQETVIELRNGQHMLDLGFHSLYLAYLCEPDGYVKTCQDVEQHTLLDSMVYKERTEKSTTWSECDPCCETVEEKVIRENIYIAGKPSAQFRYKNPTLLTLGKGLLRSSACHNRCRNKLERDNPNQIDIIERTLQANFKEGHIYMQYYGLQKEEDGTVSIPESPNGHIETYIEYHLKSKLAERLISNNDAAWLSQLYPVWIQKASTAKGNAIAELKMTKLTPKALMGMNRSGKLESLQYELPNYRRH